MQKFPIIYGLAAGVLISFLFVKFVFADSNLLLLLSCFSLAIGTLVALFEMKEATSTTASGENEPDAENRVSSP